MKLILISRRFWPLMGGGEQVMANLAQAFTEQGHDATVLTAAWEPQWPREIEHRGFQVVRLPQPAIRGLGTLRYSWALSGWLKKHVKQYDAVLVSMLKHDAYAAVGALKASGKPIVIRAEGGGETGDCAWHEKGRFGKSIRRRTLGASAFIAPSPAIADELIAAGYPESQVNYVPNGVAISPGNNAERKRQCRSELAEIFPKLRVDPDARVVIYTGRLHERKGLADLVNAWKPLAKELPNSRLWLVGEGDERNRLTEQISSLGLQNQIVMPGRMDQHNHIEMALQAADLYVLPSYEEGMSIALLEAMSAGTPVVATDIPGNRLLIDHEQTGVIVPVQSPAAIQSAILGLLANEEERSRLAVAAKNVVQQKFSIQQMALRHLELMS